MTELQLATPRPDLISSDLISSYPISSHLISSHFISSSLISSNPAYSSLRPLPQHYCRLCSQLLHDALLLSPPIPCMSILLPSTLPFVLFPSTRGIQTHMLAVLAHVAACRCLHMFCCRCLHMFCCRCLRMLLAHVVLSLLAHAACTCSIVAACTCPLLLFAYATPSLCD